MTSFHSFESIEEMELMMRTEAELALQRALPIQRAIEGGDYWMRLADGLVIFGYVYTFTEALLGELEAGTPKRQAKEGDRDLRAAHDLGYRFGKAYSMACPDGEVGSTHVVDILKIPEADWKYAQRFEWDFMSLLENGHGNMMRLARKYDRVMQEVNNVK